MLSFNKDFVVYNLSHSFVNTYRYLTIHKNIRLNCNNIVMLDFIKIKYTSPLMSDFNNSFILGAFLIIRLLTGQFPYISKYKITSTFKEQSHRVIVSVSLKSVNLYKFLNWCFIQFINPVTNNNVNIVSSNKDSVVIRLDSYNLLKQVSVHPLFFKWTEPLYFKLGFNLTFKQIKGMLKIT